MATTERRQFARDMENRSGVFGRRTSPRKLQKSRVERSDNSGSPLRSPLRTNIENSKDNTYSKKRRRNNRREKEKSNFTKSTSDKEETTLIKEDEFPPLSVEEWYTPENRKWGTGSRKLSWSEEKEREEQTQEKSRRKLDLRDKLTGKKDLGGRVEAQKRPKLLEVETDDRLLTRRQKDLDYGKNTVAYDRYSSMILRHKRVKGVHPKTPSKLQKVSRRSWDAQVKIWRKSLHQWDPPSSSKDQTGVDYLDMEDIEDPLDGSSSQLSSIEEERPNLASVNSSDADAEDESSQNSESPGITLTPDSKCVTNPFKYPKSKPTTAGTKQRVSQRNVNVEVKLEKDDDGFFSGIDLEDMDTS